LFRDENIGSKAPSRCTIIEFVGYEESTTLVDSEVTKLTSASIGYLLRVTCRFSRQWAGKLPKG
jgi:preprotein translocase subunit SecF